MGDRFRNIGNAAMLGFTGEAVLASGLGASFGSSLLLGALLGAWAGYRASKTP